MDGTNRIGLQGGVSKIAGIGFTDGVGLRIEPHAQFLLPGKTVGLYGHMPITRMIVSDATDATGLGNPELGVFYLLGGSTSLIFRGGLTFGVASDSPLGELANATTIYERLTDVINVSPKATAARLSVSTMRSFTALFFRADLGLDVAISNKSEQDVFMHGNLALGVRVPYVDLSIESVNVGTLDGDYPSISDRFVHTAGFGLATRGANQLHLGWITPLDSAVRGEAWVAAIGYQRALQ
jgi:hypothetical protein